ncbi:MAG: tRNA pseudouridine(38-40) synthase TruA [Weeksellaceae bacterium]
MRYFLEIAYKGEKYFGWQRQPRQITVQEVVEDALTKLLRTPTTVYAAGRTDTGVHAKKMYAHFDYNEPLHPQLVFRLNSFLPDDVSISKIIPVTENAHSRFDATERTYHYYVQIGKDPFTFDSSWQVIQELNMEKMNEAAKLLLGKQDFSSFARSKTDVKTHICTVRFAEWERNGDVLKFTIIADRFLRNMVRAIVGTLVNVGKERISIPKFSLIIAQKERKFASVSAPAKGLFLAEVEYPKEIFLNE